ncbi:MAG: MerC domain-containing protein [Rehaibacterium terrae]|uniref:MerC domain-containing protein n=1 Tax=Rehaibacterium terrae TaxID=1341696 RepID=UPI00391BDD58
MPLPSPTSITATVADRIGASGSFLCAVHCALGPVMLAILPTASLGVLWSESFESIFTVFATVLGLAALAFGYRRHRRVHAWPILLLGLAALWADTIYEPLHTQAVPHALVMTLGALLVAVAHVVNLRLSHAPALSGDSPD